MFDFGSSRNSWTDAALLQNSAAIAVAWPSATKPVEYAIDESFSIESNSRTHRNDQSTQTGLVLRFPELVRIGPATHLLNLRADEAIEFRCQHRHSFDG